MKHPNTLLAITAFALVTGQAFAADFAPFHSRVGTQTFDPAYQFESGTKDKLTETIDRIEAMGSDIVKFEMSDRVDSTYNISLSGINTLSDLYASPVYQDVFTRRFSTYSIWAFPLTIASLNNHWRDGYPGFADYPYDGSDPDTEAKREYQELYDFVVTLRNDGNLAGKTILIGHWEGDNALRNNSQDPNYDPGTTAINGMKEWYRNRQRAVDDAKAATASSNVQIYHYAEVNLVLQLQWNSAYKTVITDVIDDPAVQVDLVSYSCYDVSTNPPPPTIPDSNIVNWLNWSLNKIQTDASFTGNFPLSRKVFIGEYGMPRLRWNGSAWEAFFSEQQQADRAAVMMKAASNWGTPYIYYWQMFNNESSGSGPDVGYWLIDDNNVTQEVYYTHQEYIGKSHTMKNLYRTWLERNPTEAEMNAFGNAFDTYSVSSRLNTILDSSEYQTAISNADYASFLAGQLHGDANDPVRNVYLTWLGSMSRSAVLDAALNDTYFENNVTDADFAQYLHEKTWQQVSPNPGDVSATETQLGSTPRATVWRSFLDDPEFYMAEFAIQDDNEIGSVTVLEKVFFEGLNQQSTQVNDWYIY